MNVEAWGPLAALAGVIVGWLAGRGKNRADAASVIQDAALELVQPLRADLREVRGELTVYRERVGALERQERDTLHLLATHAGWDMALATAARSAGVAVPDMPPLFPPSRAERTRATDRQPLPAPGRWPTADQETRRAAGA